jgi:hypothetical protein
MFRGVTALGLRLLTIEIVPAWDPKSCTIGPLWRLSLFPSVTRGGANTFLKVGGEGNEDFFQVNGGGRIHFPN